MPSDPKDKEITTLKKDIIKLKKDNEKLQTNLKKQVDKIDMAKEKKKSKIKKKPSAYNEFVGKHIGIIKKDDPTISHQDAFKKAVEEWNAQK